MKLAVYLGCAALILSLGMASADEVVARIAPGITLVPHDGTRFPDFTIPAEMDQYRHAYFVLINDSDRAITALTVVWSYTSMDTGRFKDGLQSTLDSYMLDKSQFRPVAAAHSRCPVDPGLQALYGFNDARDKKITVRVDSIIFEDGEIVGPDSLKTADEITARYSAAREVSTRFHLGQLAGKGPEQVAQDIHQLPTADNSKSVWWRNHYASKIAASVRENPKATALHLRDFDLMVEPPKFFRRQQ